MMSLTAKLKISCSICWSSPMSMMISVMASSFSLSATSSTVVITDSASAHSCIGWGIHKNGV